MNTSHDLPEPPADTPAEPPVGHETLPPPPLQSESAKFFQWLRSLGFQRGSSRWVGGVCSGLATKWGIDPVIVRGLTVVLTLFFGVGLLAYGVAWALLPEPDGRIHVEEVARGRWSSGMTGAGVMTLLGFAGPGQGFIFDGGGWFPWSVIWIGPVFWLIYWAVNRDKPEGTVPKNLGTPAQHGPGTSGSAQQSGADWYGNDSDEKLGQPYGGWPGSTPPGGAPQQPLQYAQGFRPEPGQYVKPQHPKQEYAKQQPVKTKPRLGAAGSFLVLGAAAVVGAAVLLLHVGNIIDLGGYEAGVAAAAAAITAGLGIVVAGILGRTAGGLGTFAIVALVFAGMLSLPANNTPFTAFNDTTWAPTSIEAAETGRTVVLGNATFDLTQFDGGSALSADVQVSLKAVTANMTVKVPSDIPVTINSELAAASFSIDGKNDGGVLTQDMATNLNPGAKGPVLVISLQGVASNIDIVTAAVAP
ncbi:PspC domain-containing protein [Arthrobacter sp. PAMC 25486]|uniref:PspC domain-containing protein n=1 Tax=Arthrobacter sp. PAMC 25486 TaxID=1494608 RepID=UPI00068C4DD4|nr:PspC domain-containing protein [Arthrobacter sp. PAMC 25486]